MKEMLTDELLENLAEMYRAYVEAMELMDEDYIITFDEYVEMMLKFREKKLRKGKIYLVK